jgi:hypothetical protein
VTQVPRELWPIVGRLAASGGWPPRGDAEVAAFFDLADRQRLLPLLLADEDVPPQIAAAKARFRAAEALNRRRFELSRDAILELKRVLGADAFVIYKGADYRHRIYSRPELRLMSDVDIYMPPETIPAALAKLAAAGYARKFSDFGAAFSPWHHEYSIAVGSVHVELHRSLCQRVRANIDYAGMWRRREWFERDGVSGYRLSAADAILVHAFQLARDEFSTELNRYVDLYLLLQQYEGELALCVTRAKAWGIERPFFGALHVVSTIFPSARTAAVTAAIERLLSPSIRRFLIDRVLPDPASEPGGRVGGRLVQLWRKFSLIDRYWRRIALVGYHLIETAVGSAIEWRTRRSGLPIPPRPKARSR